MLLDFLHESYQQCDVDGDVDVDEDDEDYVDDSEIPAAGIVIEEDRSQIVWMSNDVFLFVVFGRFSLEHVNACWDHSADKVYSTYLNNEVGRVSIIQKPSLAAKEGASFKSDVVTSPGLVDVMDVVLRLLARHKKLTYLDLLTSVPRNNFDNNNNAEFPASLNALQAFVSEAQSDRTIRLKGTALSMEQLQVVTRHCNKYVTIRIQYDFFENIGRDTILENAILRHCPAKIELYGVEFAPADKRQLLLTALQSTASMEELNVLFNAGKKESIISCVDVISRNRHFQRLGLKFLFHLDKLFFEHVTEYVDPGVDKVYSIYLDQASGRIYIIQKTHMAAKRAPFQSDWTAPGLVEVMDVVLRLLAMHKKLVYLDLETTDGDCPASLHALLKTFVSEAQSARKIRLRDAGLSQEQCETDALLENAILNHCPAKIELYGVEDAPADKRQLLLTALESTTSMEELNVYFNVGKKESIISCIGLISRNRHFKKLRLKCLIRADEYPFVIFDLTLEEWELFCGALASHPTLQEVHVSCCSSSYERHVSPSSRSVEKD